MKMYAMWYEIIFFFCLFVFLNQSDCYPNVFIAYNVLLTMHVIVAFEYRFFFKTEVIKEKRIRNIEWFDNIMYKERCVR